MTDSSKQPTNILTFSQPTQFDGEVVGETRAFIVASELIAGMVPFSFRPAQTDGYVFSVEPACSQFLSLIINQTSNPQ